MLETLNKSIYLKDLTLPEPILSSPKQDFFEFNNIKLTDKDMTNIITENENQLEKDNYHFLAELKYLLPTHPVIEGLMKNRTIQIQALDTLSNISQKCLSSHNVHNEALEMLINYVTTLSDLKLLWKKHISRSHFWLIESGMLHLYNAPTKKSFDIIEALRIIDPERFTINDPLIQKLMNQPSWKHANFSTELKEAAVKKMLQPDRKSTFLDNINLKLSFELDLNFGHTSSDTSGYIRFIENSFYILLLQSKNLSFTEEGLQLSPLEKGLPLDQKISATIPTRRKF